MKVVWRYLLLAVLSVLFFSAGAKPAHACQETSSLSSCCSQLKPAPVKQDCCSGKVETEQGCAKLDTCACATPANDAIPTAFSLKLLPLQLIRKAYSANIEWQIAYVSPDLRHYDPPNLRQPREKIYIEIRSLLI